jgi:hypothetical protein
MGRVASSKKANHHMPTHNDPWGDNVLVEFEDGIAWVTLNRPEKRLQSTEVSPPPPLLQNTNIKLPLYRNSLTSL